MVADRVARIGFSIADHLAIACRQALDQVPDLVDLRPADIGLRGLAITQQDHEHQAGTHCTKSIRAPAGSHLLFAAAFRDDMASGRPLLTFEADTGLGHEGTDSTPWA